MPLNLTCTFGVVSIDWKTEVTFALALLHGGRTLMIQALVGRLARVGQTLDRAHLLTQPTFGGALRDVTHKSKNLCEVKYFIIPYKKNTFYIRTRHL